MDAKSAFRRMEPNRVDGLVSGAIIPANSWVYSSFKSILMGACSGSRAL